MKNHTRGAPDESGQGAQSESVGLVIIFGIVFISISIILLLGLPVLEDARDKTQLERFKSEFGILNQQIRESIYAPGQSSASISLANGRISVDDGSNSMSINITYTPKGGTPVSTGEMPLGRLMFDGDGDTGVAYEGGGVWTASRNGVSLGSPPDISYTGNTLNMNLINFTNDTGLAGNTRGTLYFSSEGTHRSDKLRNITNSSLGPGKLDISVRSEFEQGWGDYFNRTFTGSAVSVEVNKASPNDGRGFANVTLSTGPPVFGVEYLEGRYEDQDPPPLNKVVNVTDLRTGSEDGFNYTFDAGTSPPPIDPLPVGAGGIGTCLTSATAEPLPPPSDTVGAGTYEASSSNALNGGYSFDTSGGPVGVSVSSDLNLGGPISVNGSNPVFVYVGGTFSMSSSVEIDLKNNRSELFQVYSAGSAPTTIDGNYNGTIYAPSSDIKISSQFRGAAIGDSVQVVSGEYYHDAALRQAELPDCIDPPLRNLNAFERRISVR